MSSPAPDPSTRRRRVLPRQQRLDDIVDVATRLFSERGYEQTSVNELAAAMNISIGGLYRYLTTKSDALVMVCENIYGDLPERLQQVADGVPDEVERTRAVLTTYLESCLESRALILLMYREYRHLPEDAQERYKDRERSIAALLRRAVEAGQRTGRFRPLDAGLFAQDVLLLGHLPALKGWGLPPSSRRRRGTIVSAQAELLMAALHTADPATSRR